MSMSAKTTRHGVSIRLSGAHAENFVKAVMAEQTNKKAAAQPEEGQMKSFEQLAKVGYQVYREAVAQKRSADLPAWSLLASEEQASWIAATKVIAAEIAAIH